MISIDSITEPGNIKAYRITNADNKQWLLPVDGLSTALELYQPSGRKGKILKQWFPVLHRIPAVRNIAHASTVCVNLRSDILQMAEEAFGTDNLNYSIFGGTPSVHQKITIQFFKGTKIAGYCKLTDSTEVAKLFTHEESLLGKLSGSGIHGIPKCLGCATLADGIHTFIQSTIKTRHSYSPCRWQPEHQQFINQLANNTSLTLSFENSDFGRSMISLHNRIETIPHPFRSTIGSALEKLIELYSGETSQYSAFHADFTPWNMFVERGKLFVFDWEYGASSYPPKLDRYHFHIQQSLHVSHSEPMAALSGIRSMNWFDPYMLRIYLLDIISRFTRREPGEFPPQLQASLASWTSMLKLTERL